MSREFIFVKEEPRGPSQLVEVPVIQAGTQRVQFPDVQQLRSTSDLKIIIKGVRLITDEVLTNGTITGNQNAPVTELQKASLVIYCEGWEKAQFIPLLVLNDMVLPGGNNPHRYAPTRFADWERVDWPKSYVQFSNGTNAVLPGGNPYCFMFDIEYERLNAQGKLISQGANP